MSDHYPTDKELAVSIVNTYIASVNPQYQTALTVDGVVEMIEKVNKALIALPTKFNS